MKSENPVRSIKILLNIPVLRRATMSDIEQHHSKHRKYSALKGIHWRFLAGWLELSSYQL